MNYNFEPGDKILERSLLPALKKNVWRLASWGTSATHNHDGTVIRGYEYIPYCGNEHLWLTSNDPKPKRWRGVKGDVYYYVSSNLTVQTIIEFNDSLANDLYNAGNYFQTREEAEEVANEIKKIFLPEYLEKNNDTINCQSND